VRGVLPKTSVRVKSEQADPSGSLPRRRGDTWVVLPAVIRGSFIGRLRGQVTRFVYSGERLITFLQVDGSGRRQKIRFVNWTVRTMSIMFNARPSRDR